MRNQAKIITKKEMDFWRKRGDRRNTISLKRCGGMIKKQKQIIENAEKEKRKLRREYLIIHLALQK